MRKIHKFMGTQILRPINCLGNQFRRETVASTPRIRPRPDPNLEKTDAKRKSFQSRRGHRSPPEPMVAKSPSRNLVIGHVKILKRGETLEASVKTPDLRGNRIPRSSRGGGELDLAFRSTKPETTQKKKTSISKLKEANGAYAVFLFSSSPPPNSLPVPGFLAISGQRSARSAQRQQLSICSA